MSRLLLALLVVGTARAETATFRLTPEKTDTQFHTFTIQVERRAEAGMGKVLQVRVAVKRKAGGRRCRRWPRRWPGWPERPAREGRPASSRTAGSSRHGRSRRPSRPVCRSS